MDQYKLGAVNINASCMDETWTRGYCEEYGTKAKEMGIVIGEVGFWENLIPEDDEVKQKRFNRLCEVIKLADTMKARCVVALIGTKDKSDSMFAPHPYLFTQECKNEMREYVLRLLDKSNPQYTKFAFESWNNSFFYQFEEIAKFFDRVNHPQFGIHLDMMNYFSPFNYFESTSVISAVIDHFGDDIISCHMKDILWDHKSFFLYLKEVMIGDGVMDYDTYLKKLSELGRDVTCFCEHLPSEEKYLENIARLHQLAEKNGLSFNTRLS
jgi:sugar phosphate isomerase/epimerase